MIKVQNMGISAAREGERLVIPVYSPEPSNVAKPAAVMRRGVEHHYPMNAEIDKKAPGFDKKNLLVLSEDAVIYVEGLTEKRADQVAMLRYVQRKKHKIDVKYLPKEARRAAIRKFLGKDAEERLPLSLPASTKPVDVDRVEIGAAVPDPTNLLRQKAQIVYGQKEYVSLENIPQTELAAMRGEERASYYLRTHNFHKFVVESIELRKSEDQIYWSILDSKVMSDWVRVLAQIHTDTEDHIRLRTVVRYEIRRIMNPEGMLEKLEVPD
jgi:hypothetical protein